MTTITRPRRIRAAADHGAAAPMPAPSRPDHRRAAVLGMAPILSVAPALSVALVLSFALGLHGEARAQETAPAPHLPAPRVLTPADRLSYTTAFDALRRGELEAARAAARQAQDRVLMGQVEFERLFHPSHSAAYDELTAWLEAYHDLPMAGRVYNLALRRRPDGAPEPRRPGALSFFAPRPSEDPARAARVALNQDDLDGAVRMGRELGDWWTVGLASWRLSRFDESFSAFLRVLEDPTQDAWVRAGAAFWAARAAERAGRPEAAEPLLRQAADWPATFYGQIALRRLGLEPAIANLGPTPYYALAAGPANPQDRPHDIDAAAFAAFLEDDARARRALALFEIGRRSEAEGELRRGLRTADESARPLWLALARIVGAGAADAEAVRIDALSYPLPPLQPEGGFTIERALVYAIARKETGFNAEARSAAGAYGVMQVMPATAAELSGDPGFVAQPQRLLEPAVNLRLGQAYVNRMLQTPAFQGDLLRAVASYNAGPGPMLAALRRLGPDADSLLLIETIDVPQARDYVEKVVAAYWIYQRLLGGPLNTLDAAAAGAGLVPIGLDYVPPSPASVETAQTVETVATIALAAADPDAAR